MMDWNIQARAHACQACNQAFADKQPFFTMLFDQKQGYERLDVCQKCWEAQNSAPPSERKEFISHWQGVYHVPPAHAPEAIQKETAEGVLRKLMEDNDPAHAGARYILAVMLERKRIFKVKAQLCQDNQRVFVYEHAKTGELFNIPDPDLHLDQLHDVQKDVSELLEGAGSAKLAQGSSSPATESTTASGEETPAEPAAANSAT